MENNDEFLFDSVLNITIVYLALAEDYANPYDYILRCNIQEKVVSIMNFFSHANMSAPTQSLKKIFEKSILCSGDNKYSFIKPNLLIENLVTEFVDLIKIMQKKNYEEIRLGRIEEYLRASASYYEGIAEYYKGHSDYNKIRKICYLGATECYSCVTECLEKEAVKCLGENDNVPGAIVCYISATRYHEKAARCYEENGDTLEAVKHLGKAIECRIKNNKYWEVAECLEKIARCLEKIAVGHYKEYNDTLETSAECHKKITEYLKRTVKCLEGCKDNKRVIEYREKLAGYLEKDRYNLKEIATCFEEMANEYYEEAKKIRRINEYYKEEEEEMKRLVEAVKCLGEDQIIVKK